MLGLLGYEQGDAGRASGEEKRRSQQERATQGPPRQTAKLQEWLEWLECLRESVEGAGWTRGRGDGREQYGVHCSTVAPVRGWQAPSRVAFGQRAPAIIFFFTLRTLGAVAWLWDSPRPTWGSCAENSVYEDRRKEGRVRQQTWRKGDGQQIRAPALRTTSEDGEGTSSVWSRWRRPKHCAILNLACWCKLETS